jgi:thiosulfate/3-mercaptopyruvate sulfurtransferase
MHTTLIDPTSLSGHIADPGWVIIDCRFDLAAPESGERQYLEGHIPGARYAHLDRHLSGVKTGTNGRHPLPEPDAICRSFGELGIAPGRQVVAYDADSAMFAARLWWMLRWMGHDAVAVLDGGLTRWRHEGHAVRAGAESWAPAAFTGSPRPGWVVPVKEVEALVRARARSARLVDSRSPERYQGINETIDKVGGHIPGAANYFYEQNLTGDRRFKPADELRRQWAPVIKNHRPADVVVYCGSGVTACHNLLALEHAGIHGVRIFPGSWSEWSADPSRPVATDPET